MDTTKPRFAIVKSRNVIYSHDVTSTSSCHIKCQITKHNVTSTSKRHIRLYNCIEAKQFSKETTFYDIFTIALLFQFSNCLFVVLIRSNYFQL